MNQSLLNTAVQKYIAENLEAEVTRIALAASPFKELSSRELAEQIDGRQRARKKLPLWCTTPGIVFPPKLSVEQCSSELTARYKSLLAKGKTLADLTGGFGVDSFYFSKQLEKVIHFERNEDLSILAAYNAGVLGASNIQFVHADGVAYLKQTKEQFDTIYIDPSRRVEHQKVFLLKDTEPNVLSHLPLFFSKADRVLIKTSPLLDIHSGLQELSQVSSVHVISVKNECKELLWVLDKNFCGETSIVAAALDGSGGTRLFEFLPSTEKQLQLEAFSAPLTFLYEPDACVLKAGAFKSIAEAYKTQKLHPSSHLYTSADLINDFIGKTFRIIHVSDYKAFMKENKIGKANVISRNFPLSVEKIKKQHKISDGGAEYLIFTKAFPDKLLVIHTRLHSE